MRKHIFLFFLALIFLTACNNDTPKGIIERDRMVKLMIDVHLTDGTIYNLNEANSDTLYKYGYDKFIKLFKSYQTDSTQFKKSLRYYTQHTEIMSGMYDEVMASLQAKNDSLIKARAEEAKKKSQPKPNVVPKK